MLLGTMVEVGVDVASAHTGVRRGKYARESDRTRRLALVVASPEYAVV